MRTLEFLGAVIQMASVTDDVTSDQIHGLTGESYDAIAAAASRCETKGCVRITNGPGNNAEGSGFLQHFRLVEKGRAAI